MTFKMERKSGAGGGEGEKRQIEQERVGLTCKIDEREREWEREWETGREIVKK